MSDEENPVTGTATDDLVAQLLDDDNLVGARLMATSVPQTLQAFMNSELRRGTPPDEIVDITTQVMASFAGSIIGIFGDPANDQQSATDTVARFERTLRAIIPSVRSFNNEQT